MSAKLDLSTLPPEVRQKVEAGLARLPPETRRKWEEQGSPLLARLVAGLAGAAETVRQPPPLPGKPTAPPASAWRTPERPARTATENVSPPREGSTTPTVIRRTPPWSHYNDTIAPGDRPGFVQKVLTAAAIAGAVAWVYF